VRERAVGDSTTGSTERRLDARSEIALESRETSWPSAASRRM